MGLMNLTQRKGHFLNRTSILTFYYTYSIYLVDYILIYLCLLNNR